MSRKQPVSLMYRLMKKLNPLVANNYQKRIGPGRAILLLTTTGRKSSLPRVTPLQFEEVDGEYYIGSARGAEADWYRNILANQEVEVQIQEHCFHGIAEPVCDPGRVADFLALRAKRRPLFIGLLMRLEGLPWRYNRLDLERFAAQKTLVIIRKQSVTASIE